MPKDKTPAQITKEAGYLDAYRQKYKPTSSLNSQTALAADEELSEVILFPRDLEESDIKNESGVHICDAYEDSITAILDRASATSTTLIDNQSQQQPADANEDQQLVDPLDEHETAPTKSYKAPLPEVKATTITAAWQRKKNIGSAMETTAQLVRSFASKQALTTTGIITSIIQPSAIASLVGEYAGHLNGISPEITSYPEDTVLKLRSYVECIEGTYIVDGLAIFDKLNGEPYDCYKIFCIYRDMPLKYDKRNFATVARLTGESLKTINTLRYMYYWDYRIKAFDMYRAGQKALKRVKLQEDLMEKHLAMTTDLLAHGMEFIESNPMALDAKSAIDLIKFAFEAGRLSVGLAKDKPNTNDSSQDGSGTSISFTHTTTHAQNGNVPNNGNASGVSAINKSEVQVRLEADMKDENTLLSVLNVLSQSGALNAAIDPDGITRVEPEPDDITVEYEELSDVSFEPHRLLVTASPGGVTDIDEESTRPMEAAIKGGKV